MTNTQPSKIVPNSLMRETQLLVETAIELAQLRRRQPSEDLMTNIVNAEVDGTRLTDEQIGAFMILLTSAGNDTTKQTTTHAMKALVEHPEQRAWLMDDFDGRIGLAIEEFVRWASPVIQFARFATRTPRSPASASRPARRWACFTARQTGTSRCSATLIRFDVARSPNPHIAFGGLGPHYCLGNQLAKVELRHLFRELLTRLRRVEFGEPAYLQSSFVHGIKRLPAFVE